MRARMLHVLRIGVLVALGLVKRTQQDDPGFGRGMGDGKGLQRVRPDATVRHRLPGGQGGNGHRRQKRYQISGPSSSITR